MLTDTERSRNVTERKLNDPVMQKRRGQGTYEEIKKKRYLEEMEKVWSKKEKSLRHKEMKLKKLAIRENVEENEDHEEEAEKETDEQKEERERKELEVKKAVKKEKWRNMMVFMICGFFIGFNSLEYYTKIVKIVEKIFIILCLFKIRNGKRKRQARRLKKFDTLLRVDPTIEDEHMDEFIIPRGAEKFLDLEKGEQLSSHTRDAAIPRAMKRFDRFITVQVCKEHLVFLFVPQKGKWRNRRW